MPLRITTQARGSAGPRRRAVLAWAAGLGPGLAAAALTGCADTVPAADSRAAGHDTRLRTTAAADSVTLLARYDATVAAHPRLAGRLAPLRAQVALHAQAFGSAPTGSASPSPSSSPSGSPSPSPSGPGRTGATGAPAVPADQDAAVGALAGAEQRTADARTAALADASPELARLLASVAACGACHVLLLQGGA